MSYLDWYVGMKVVFVGWPDDALDAGLISPFKENHVYTVEEIKMLDEGSHVFANGQTFKLPEDVVYIRLLGLLVMADGFRPVQPRKTDISIFTAMITSAKERERA